MNICFSSTFEKLYFNVCMLEQFRSIYNCSSVSLWFEISRVKGWGTNSRMRGNILSSIYLRSKQSDFPFEPMIPFLISISSFILRYFSKAIIFSRSYLYFFCSQDCNYSVKPYIFYSNSDILITLSLIYFRFFAI